LFGGPARQLASPPLNGMGEILDSVTKFGSAHLVSFLAGLDRAGLNRVGRPALPSLEFILPLHHLY